MANNKTAVFGIYAGRKQCEEAADELISSGFLPTDMSVLLPENLANATNIAEGRPQSGGILFSVYCETAEQAKAATDILRRTGADDIAEAPESSTAKKERELGRRAAGSQ